MGFRSVLPLPFGVSAGAAAPVITLPAPIGGIRLALQLYNAPDGALLADFSNAESCVATTGAHGFRSLSCFVPMTLAESFVYYDQAPGKWLSLNYGAGAAWEGRVEDREIVDGGLRLTAFGAWQAMYDVPYTALWSAGGVAGWRPLTTDEFSDATPEKYEIDNNNRIYVAPKKGEIFQNAPHKIGRIGFQIPDDSSREFVGVQFDYEFAGVSPWRGQLNTNDAAWGSGASVWSVIGTGSVQTGSVHLTLTARASAQFLVLYNSGTPAVYSGETGDTYLKITNLRFVTTTTNRVNTTTATTISAGSQVVTPADMSRIYVGQRLFVDAGLATSESVTITAVSATTFTATFANSYSGTTTIQAHVVYADEIVTDLVGHTSGINSGQLSDSTALIESPALDLADEVYEDEWPGDIATKLAGLGDNQVPPRLWEVGVWEDRRLHFRPRGSAGRQWSVDVEAFEVNSTLENLFNSAYGVYRGNGRALRTAVANDAASQARYGIVRRRAVGAQTTSETQAAVQRDAALADGATIRPRSSLAPDFLMDATGAIYPKWMCRGGDELTIRNLPPTLSVDIDRIRTFLLAEVTYDALVDKFEPVPEEPPASLEVLVARRAEGI